MENTKMNEPKPTQPTHAGIKISAVIPSVSYRGTGIFTDEFIKHAEKTYGEIPMSARDISKDTERALGKLYEQYAKQLPHNPNHASKILQEEAARIEAERQMDTDAYDQKVLDALNNEANPAVNSDDPSHSKVNERLQELRKKSEQGPLSKEEAEEYDELKSQTQGGMMGAGLNLFQSLAKRLAGGGDPAKVVTNQVIQNNAKLRHIANDLDNASTLAAITQNNLRSHLATLNFDVDKGIRDLSSNITESHEAQAILASPETAELMHANDAAQANLLSKMNPQNLRAVQEISETGLVNRKLEVRVEKALEKATETVEANDKLPSNNGMIKKIMDSVKNFVAAIQSMLGIGNDATKGMAR